MLRFNGEFSSRVSVVEFSRHRPPLAGKLNHLYEESQIFRHINHGIEKISEGVLAPIIYQQCLADIQGTYNISAVPS